MNRTMTITVSDDWKAGLRQAGALAQAGIETGRYQGEFLNFTTSATFFGQLTPHRWNILIALMGSGTVGVRELARRFGRDVKRTHADAKVLVEMGLVEKTETGVLCCPYERINIDMVLEPHLC